MTVPGFETDGASEVFGIQQVARELGITQRTLRFYEDKGLIEPQRAGAGPDQGAAGRGFVVHGESLRGGLIRTRPLMPASNSLYVPLTTATTLIVWLTGSTWAPMRCTRAG